MNDRSFKAVALNYFSKEPANETEHFGFYGRRILTSYCNRFFFFIGFWLLHEDQGAEQSLRLLSMG